MLAVNYSTLRNKLKDYCDKATDDFQTIVVTRKDEKNVVILSLDEYNNMLENLYIMGNKEYYSRLLKAKEQIEAGKGTSHELIED